ncbi:hypothetical protein EDD18DRAFT_1432427 [Armillaria luteobubalina]|uniref:DUF6534 domain-containing protein n=1 Tax=Armillaria luteobubalina TaxID=153913 RepID=A0AA39PGY3_9AGAR|nr:hypothetical protein EDD18DRAFT_1432427 [Armillaria luteobubalina]
MLPVPAGYHTERLFGPQIVGYLLNWGLFGALSVQLYLYYLAFPKDRRFVKSLVYGIYITELVQTILIAHDAFAVFGYGFGNLEVLVEIHFNWFVVPIMTAIVAFLGQCFYAYRIFILSRSRIIPTFIICVSLTSTVASITAGVYAFEAVDMTALHDRKTSIAVGITGIGYALCDLIIALCMTHYLTRSSTSFRCTQILVTKIIRLTIETGSVTGIAALLTIILFFAFTHQAFYMTLSLVNSKLYANSTYMVLNSRIRIMGGRDTYTSSTDMEITTNMMRDITSRSAQDVQRTPLVAITAEVFTSDDEMGRMSVSHLDSRAFLELIPPSKEKPQDGDMSLLA